MTPAPLSQVMYFEATANLTGDMLVKVDRMSMADSLEVRCPLLDHELAELRRDHSARLEDRQRPGQADSAGSAGRPPAARTADAAQVGLRRAAGRLVPHVAARISLGHLTAPRFWIAASSPRSSCVRCLKSTIPAAATTATGSGRCSCWPSGSKRPNSRSPNPSPPAVSVRAPIVL